MSLSHQALITNMNNTRASNQLAPLRSVAAAITVFLLMTLVTPAFADTFEMDDLMEMSLKELMQVEVFSAASRIPTPRAKAPGTVYSFDRYDFERLGVRRLDDLFRFVPGLQMNQYRKRHKTIWARGILDRYNDKLVLMVDGVPIRHLYYGHFATGDNMPLENIEKVEIILGPASSLYGANAFGGVISVTTRPVGDPAVEVSAEGGNHQRLKGTVGYTGESIRVFASGLSQDAPFRADRQSFVGNSTEQPLDEHYGALSIKAAPMTGLTFLLDYQDNKTPFVFMASGQEVFIEERPLTLAALYEAGTVETGRVEARLNWRRDEIREFNVEQHTGALAYEEKQNAQSIDAVITGFRRIGDGTAIFGGSWGQAKATDMDYTLFWHYKVGFLHTPESGSLLSDPNVKTNDYGLFGQYVWDAADTFTLTVGGRYDFYEAFDDYFSCRIAAVWAPDDRQVVKLLYGTAHRTPNYREYLKVMEQEDFVPPVPKPEEMRSAELGYSYQFDNTTVTTTLFSNEFTNFIQEKPTPDGGDEYFANHTDPHLMRGVETLVRYEPSHWVSIHANAAYLLADHADGEALPYLATWTAGMNVIFHYGHFQHVAISSVYNSDRADTNEYTTDDSAAYTLVNLTLFGEITKTIGYSAGVDNVLDEQVYDPAGDYGSNHNTEQGERELWIKLEYKTAL